MSATEESVRTLDDVQLPPAGTWEIDPVHSQVSFVVRHMMVSKVRGRFTKFSSTIEVAENHQDSKVEATIDAANANLPVARLTAISQTVAELMKMSLAPSSMASRTRGFSSTSMRPNSRLGWRLTRRIGIRTKRS